MKDRELWEIGLKARENAYAPYSGFKVGAVLVDSQGTIYTGCNVENASLGLTICAERVAIVKAVSEGKRDFSRLLVVGGEEITYPCGACRQVLNEFAPGLEVVCTNSEGQMAVYTLKDLLPLGFTLKSRSGGKV